MQETSHTREISGGEQITESFARKTLAFMPVRWGSQGECEWRRNMIYLPFNIFVERVLRINWGDQGEDREIS